MKSPTPPPPPDPVATAQAQSGMNRDTAVSQQLINMTDQYTPDGTLRYAQDGFNEFTDAQGKLVRIPKFRATQELSAASKGIYDTNKQTEQNIATLGRDQSARLNTLLGTPVDLNNDAVEARLMELGSKRLTPEFARNEEAMRTRLLNSGIREGSAAWNSEMGRLDQGKNDAINQLLLGGRGQAIQEILTQRNQPINEITALLSGSQVSMPQFTSTPQSGVAGTDYAGMVRDKYAGDMNIWQQKNANNQALMGGLFGLAGAASKMVKPF